jgi:DNA-binding response OmpR family regulator
MEGMPAETILVVDDDPTCLSIMTDVLERAGYLVESASDGTRALARLVDRRYALVVADVSMPRLPGLALVAELRRVRPGVPALLVSAFPDERTCAAARRLGVPLLPKPFHADALVSRVRQLLHSQALDSSP